MIHFASQEVKIELKSKTILKAWIRDIIKGQGKSVGEISYVFCSDAFLAEMNKKYLNHLSLTDIITFNYNENNKISGDIFISIERVKENALKYSGSFDAELYRVMAHGVLHLLGFKDKSKADKEEMRNREDECLSVISQQISV
ncbi:MAG: rRNA maturation RNase YbeY [Bacteroidales bacterium]|nr:rRNA maturation RNase YbeY [Bacteroidales bacterium]MBK7172148.1 rRNA maturation RNase YbeY [Bacteroidales bacterium]